MRKHNEGVARVDFTLIINCPECDEAMDLADEDAEYDFQFSQAIFGGKWNDIIGLEVTCDECDHEFGITEVKRFGQD